jgi:hypothetical protein
LRAGEGKVFGADSKPFSNGIRPYVGRDPFDTLRSTYNVIVVAHFPEANSVALFKVKCRSKLECSDKFQEVTAYLSAMNEKVEMIWHSTVRVHEESVLCCALEQNSEGMLGSSTDVQVRRAAVAAVGYEVGLFAEAVGARQAGGFAAERHFLDITTHVYNVTILVKEPI